MLCLLPVSELRGGLPFALSQGVPPLPAYLYCVAFNALVAPLVFFFLSTLHKLLLPVRLYRSLFDRVVVRARSKLQGKVERFGYWGLVLFVGIPLPITGAYTGTLGAWILGMERRRTLLFVTIGVLLSGLIVSLAYYLVTVLGIEALKLFLKSGRL